MYPYAICQGYQIIHKSRLFCFFEILGKLTAASIWVTIFSKGFQALQDYAYHRYVVMRTTKTTFTVEETAVDNGFTILTNYVN